MKKLLLFLAAVVGLILADRVLLAGNVIYQQDADFSQGASFSLPLEAGKHSVELTTRAPLMLSWRVGAPDPNQSIEGREYKPDHGKRIFFFDADRSGLYALEVRGTLREYDDKAGASGAGNITVRADDRRVVTRLFQWF